MNETGELVAAVEALQSALARAVENFTLAVRGVPVRDMAETLTEASVANSLADLALAKVRA